MSHEKNETAARDLAAKLESTGISARVVGRGVHWRVETDAKQHRALVVHCFWYERTLSGLVLGMNPANARHALHRKVKPRIGVEYLVVVREAGERIADGRTSVEQDVVACAGRWLGHAALSDVTQALPFIDEKPRAMRAIGQRIDPRLRWDIGEEGLCELWVYGDDRSCRIAASDGSTACAFLLGKAQVAFAGDLDDIPRAVATWLVDRVSIAQLASAVRGVECERHAEMLEIDPARWHWLHVRDRIADPNDVLAPMRELIELLAASPVVASFYTYSSLDRLCFSASSHYPWVGEGLPVVARRADGDYSVSGSQRDRTDAVASIEATLAQYSIRPFFGSALDYERPILSACMASHGSALRPQLVQREGWYRLEIPSGTRRCDVNRLAVTFRDGAIVLDASWPTLDTAVAAILSFLEDGRSLDEVAADPKATKVFWARKR
jgi:hypothetical protein